MMSMLLVTVAILKIHSLLVQSTISALAKIILFSTKKLVVSTVSTNTSTFKLTVSTNVSDVTLILELSSTRTMASASAPNSLCYSMADA